MDSYEKKYKEEVARATQLWKCGDITRENLEYIFPELAESEDERIRKRIIQALHGDVLDMEETTKAIAWLEKQGEQKTIDSLTPQEAMDIAVAKCFDEQKLVHKAEPKFHEGEWITNGDYTWKIVEVKPLDYILQSQDGNIVDDAISHVDEQFHSFTIEDAKDGDVLYSPCLKILWIFKSKDTVYCGCNLNYNDGAFCGEGYIESPTDAIPATKEQRDTLMKAIADASYTFDFEKKELKKIENRPMLSDFFNAEYERGKADAISEIRKGWTEDDKNHMENILNILLIEAKNAKVEQYRSSVESDIDWIYLLKNKGRVQPKQEWSQEDEKIINKLIAVVELYYGIGDDLDKQRCHSWLKSLKQRIERR